MTPRIACFVAILAVVFPGIPLWMKHWPRQESGPGGAVVKAGDDELRTRVIGPLELTGRYPTGFV